MMNQIAIDLQNQNKCYLKKQKTSSISLTIGIALTAKYH